MSCPVPADDEALADAIAVDSATAAVQTLLASGTCSRSTLMTDTVCSKIDCWLAIVYQKLHLTYRHRLCRACQLTLAASASTFSRKLRLDEVLLGPLRRIILRDPRCRILHPFLVVFVFEMALSEKLPAEEAEIAELAVAVWLFHNVIPNNGYSIVSLLVRCKRVF